MFPLWLRAPASGQGISEEEEHAHLPRLEPGRYRGLAAVLWTASIANRRRGWLDDSFHAHWSVVLTHACARYVLLCPAYVLMPDHLHWIWLGLDEMGSDQRNATAFLRRHLRPALRGRDWDRQAHDRVLREEARNRDAFQSASYYVLANPERAELVERWESYPFIGCCLPGYPELDPREPGFWERFWRVHAYLAQRPLAGARSHEDNGSET